MVNEVVPFIRERCRQPELRIMTNGCSMGAYHAVNLFLKHPDLFAGCLALSGLYRLDRREFGMQAGDMEQVYFNSPIHYLSGIGNPWYLDWYRKSDIVLCVGQGAWEEACLEDTRSMAEIFREKQIPAWVDFWGIKYRTGKTKSLGSTRIIDFLKIFQLIIFIIFFYLRFSTKKYNVCDLDHGFAELT